MRFLRNYWGLFVVLLLSIFSILPLFHPGFFSVHDDTQVVRVSQMAKALADGQFPVRWVQDLGYGYGYPIFNFYSPLPYYVGGFFNLIGFDALVATKIMFGLGILLSGILMYLLAREFFGELGGVIAGLFYLYAPYHAVDIYVRGAVGEFWAIAFLPLMVWGFYKVAVELRWRWMVVGAVGYAGVILSHNLTAMMVTPFLVIGILGYWIIGLLGKTKLNPKPCTLYPIFLAFGLSAFYWLPALFEMGYTNVIGQIGGGANFRDHFVCLGQLWNSPWGFGGSAQGCLDGLSFKIGKLHLVLALVGLLLVFFPRKYVSFKYGIGFTFGVLLLSIFLTTQYSRSVWEAISPMVYIQYPWRFLILITFTTSFLAGSIFLWFKNHLLQFSILGFLITALLFYNVKYFQPQKYLPVTAQDFISEENIKWKTSKISDEYLPKDFPKPKNSQEVVREKVISEEGVIVKDVVVKSHRITFMAESENGGKVTVRQADFPGWQVFMDKARADFEILPKEIIINIPAGTHQVEVFLKNTGARALGNYLSLASLIILISLGIYGKKISAKG